MNTESCDLRRVEPKESLWDLEVGEFFFRVGPISQQRWMNVMLPGNNLACLPIRPLLDKDANGGHSWEWDGNEDKPTLNPSVHAVGSWHGWIRQGRAVSC